MNLFKTAVGETPMSLAIARMESPSVYKVTAMAFSCAGRPRGVSLVNCKEHDLHLYLCFP